jgi:hypothetical protein
LLAEPGDEEREAECRDISEHVASVGEQRDRVRQKTTDDLDNEEESADGERDAQARN